MALARPRLSLTFATLLLRIDSIFKKIRIIQWGGWKSLNLTVKNSICTSRQLFRFYTCKYQLDTIRLGGRLTQTSAICGMKISGIFETKE